MQFDNDRMEWIEEDEEAEVEEEEFQKQLSQGCLAEDIERACEGEEEQGSGSRRDAWSFYSLIYIMALLTCGISLLNDMVIQLGFSVRGGLLWAVVQRLESAPVVVLEVASMITWVGYEVVMVGIAHIFARQHPMSYGSGIPEIYCELQGTHMKGYVAPGILKAKLLGLTFGEIGGLPIGKEGPFVHCAAAMTRSLAQLPLFHGALRIPGCLRLLMVVSVAVGICSTVGVPIGGVLFALEVMPDSVWENISYWMSIGTATLGGVTLYLLKLMFKDVIVSLVPALPSEAQEASLVEMPVLANCTLLLLSAILGMICGLLGALFVRSQVGMARRLRAWIAGVPKREEGLGATPKAASPRLVYSKAHTMTYEEPLVEKPSRVAIPHGPKPASRQLSRRRALMLCLTVAALDGLVSFALPVVRGSSQPKLLWKLVSSSTIDWESVGSNVVPSLPHDYFVGQVPQHVCLGTLLVLKWILTTLALSLPLPTGCILPSYILGTVIGRFYAYAVMPLLGLLFGAGGAAFVVVQFSFIGATAFTCAICHSFSVVVVMFELVNAKQDVLMRMGTAAIVAIYTANMLSPSLFQASAVMKHMPQTHRGRKLWDGWAPVSEAMRTEVPTVPETFGSAMARKKVLEAALEKFAQASQFVVLASAGDCPTIVGCAERALVEEVLQGDEEAFNRGELTTAAQVPPTLAVKHAELALEVLGNGDLYIVNQGRLEGVVGFHDLVEYQRGK